MGGDGYTTGTTGKAAAPNEERGIKGATFGEEDKAGTGTGTETGVGVGSAGSEDDDGEWKLEAYMRGEAKREEPSEYRLTVFCTRLTAASTGLLPPLLLLLLLL